MNFLKGSLFRRNTELEEPEPMEESGGGILAVWGSPGCGKTVTAVKIAKHLATQKKNTVLLLCDMTAPMEKRMAMGHKADDREEQTQYQQSM